MPPGWPLENGRRCNTFELSLAYLTRASATKRPDLLPPYTTGSVRFRSNLDMKLGRVIGGWQWRAADRSCASRCGHLSRRARGRGVAFVGALCRRIDSQGVDPRSLNWKISSPGKSAGPKPRALAHAARHEAPDFSIRMIGPAFGREGPNHSSAGAVRLGDYGIVGNVDPSAPERDAVMAILRLPINIADNRAVRE